MILAENSSLLDSFLAEEFSRFDPRWYLNDFDVVVMARAWVPKYRLQVVDGPARGMSGFIERYNRTTLEVFLWDMGLEMKGTPPPKSTWEIVMEPQIGVCEYKGAVLQKVCAQETTPELAPFWLGKCADGDEDSCECLIGDTCSQEGRFRLHLNYTKPLHKEYITQLVDALDNLNKTCGALPMRDPEFFTSSLSKRCADDSDCSEVTFLRCIPGETCKCCGNLTSTCSVDAGVYVCVCARARVLQESDFDLLHHCRLCALGE